ncbi:hypothetical protein SAMN02983003_2068 [Devosia enhydra]|uniref:Cytochrome c domain-containing protein n=1 Tax=Devosia enhydra TaxID=665118 RepID=A0A1K2HXQ1_9HYPH|nr:hypothetical protein [Devosia enhydra]SFZ84532.1 hypothetical protein SAMN02983003_2068 [Devosia enhydra]
MTLDIFPAIRHVAALILGASVSCVLSLPSLADAASALPPGPREALADRVGNDVATLETLLGQSRSAEAWQAELQGSADPAVLAALGDYLARIAPAPTEASDVTSIVAALPADGKQLFVDNCLSCHGGDKYFLRQEKDFEAWMGIFDAPYHRRQLTGEGEREMFAGYAAITTPLALDPVPEALADKD